MEMKRGNAISGKYQVSAPAEFTFKLVWSFAKKVPQILTGSVKSCNLINLFHRTGID